MDHHRQVAGQNGVNLRLRVRKHLEGWDFKDLAKDRDPYPCVATLQALGYGWVDFIRSIDAITLFERGFGDIIRPIEFEEICPKWRSFPTHKYYLAKSFFDLKDMEDFGDKWANPPRPVHSLEWYCLEKVVAVCPCQGQKPHQIMRLQEFKQHHDPVQVFFPKRLRLISHILGLGELEDGGAIIFGHNVSWRYRWRKNGTEDVEEGEPVDLPEPDSRSSSQTADKRRS